MRRVTHALSVRAPSAQAIVDRVKPYEFRSWPLPERWIDRPIALHESGGAILAIVTFDGDDGGAWHVGSVVPLRTPVAARGALRFWPLPPAVRRAIARQVAPPERWNDDTAACSCALCGTRKAPW